jgi:hypothetical protein
VATSPIDEGWERVGGALAARRVQIDPSYDKRSAFARETGVDYRVLYDIEKGRRQNFGPKTIAQIEQAYHLPAGAIEAALENPDFVDFSRQPVLLRDETPPAKTTRKRLTVVPDWVANEEQRERQRLHDDAVRRGLDKAGTLVDGLNVDRHEDGLWEMLSDSDSPKFRADLIIHWRDLDAAVARKPDTSDNERDQGNGTER